MSKRFEKKPRRALGVNKPHSKREAAEKRNAKWAALSPQEQLAALDAKFGAGVGARRQRARIAAQLKK